MVFMVIGILNGLEGIRRDNKKRIKQSSFQLFDMNWPYRLKKKKAVVVINPVLAFDPALLEK